jgi:hypothetical protein
VGAPLENHERRAREPGPVHLCRFGRCFIVAARSDQDR